MEVGMFLALDLHVQVPRFLPNDFPKHYLVLGERERLHVLLILWSKLSLHPPSLPYTRWAPCSALGCPSMPAQSILLWVSPRLTPTFGHGIEEFFSVLHLCISSNKCSFHHNTYRDPVTNITFTFRGGRGRGGRIRGWGGGINSNIKKPCLSRIIGVRIELSASPSSHTLLQQGAKATPYPLHTPATHSICVKWLMTVKAKRLGGLYKLQHLPALL